MTYSLGITGAPADNPTLPLNLDIEDAAARNGNAQSAMSLGTPVLCRDIDGQERYYVYDAERSNPDLGIRVMKRLF